MREKLILSFLLGIEIVALLFQIEQLSVSSAEVYLLEQTNSYIAYLYKLIFKLFGMNDYALRIPLLIIHGVNFYLFYKLTSKYLVSVGDRLWLMLLYVILPGILSSAIVLSHASFVLFGLLLFFVLYERLTKPYMAVMLFLFVLADAGFGYLVLGLFLYTLLRKQYKESVFYGVLVAVSVSLYRYQIHGTPSGHFLDTIGIYSAIFSPIVFVYLVYVLYRRYLAGKRDLLWCVATTAFIFSILLSFRQRIDMEFLAPYLIVALPLAAKTFHHSYYVRLKQFRTRYKVVFIVTLIFLVTNIVVVFMNKQLFSYIENPKSHFAYNMYIAKELAQLLKERGISCLKTDNKMESRLQFYGIQECKQIFLKSIPPTSLQKSDVTIRYNGTTVYKADVTKINTR